MPPPASSADPTWAAELVETPVKPHILTVPVEHEDNKLPEVPGIRALVWTGMKPKHFTQKVLYGPALKTSAQENRDVVTMPAKDRGTESGDGAQR